MRLRDWGVEIKIRIQVLEWIRLGFVLGFRLGWELSLGMELVPYLWFMVWIKV